MQKVTLTGTDRKTFAYDTTSPVEFLGKFDMVIKTKERISAATFYVTKAENRGNLLRLFSLRTDKLTTKDTAIENIVQENSKVFSGLGKLEKEKIK